MNETLKDLIKKCKGAVFISANEHRDFYKTVEQYMYGLNNRKYVPAINKNVLDKMIELNTMINIHFYPKTPVSFYSVYHYDFNECLKECFKCLED